MTRTIINKLRRVRDMRRAVERGETWWTNPNGHPEPTLPSVSYLTNIYLPTVRASSPNLYEEAQKLVSSVGKARIK